LQLAVLDKEGNETNVVPLEKVAQCVVAVHVDPVRGHRTGNRGTYKAAKVCLVLV
jgi:hypothetical protein